MGGHLDNTVAFEGKLTFRDTLRIDGKFRGEIESEGHLVVGEGAEVDATIRAGSVTVAGHVTGQVHATDRLEVFKTGRLECDVITPVIRIEDGAVFHGHCETRPSPNPAGSSKPLDMSQVARQLSS